ncbi:intradiol ring-cleavage dioxygenase [Flavihumibacter sp. R14]|nr:intradiol ring-cleavage dioxygenase [Flavihumibacter soli]
MERKGFLKSLLVAAVSAPVILEACGKDAVPSTETATNTGSGSTTCAVAPTETEGPFPTHSPGSYNRSDIRDGRSGYDMTAKITIGNVNNSCAALAGAIVDIWHCDAQGNYSEYGSSNLQAAHFLRGRQVTDANGLVTFTTIFPGWYSGRATHIHVHIYDSTGKSLKVTQIAFPEGSGSAVSIVNGYDKGMSGYTSNANDGIFRDDRSGAEIATVSGSIADGFQLAMKINVAG